MSPTRLATFVAAAMLLGCGPAAETDAAQAKPAAAPAGGAGPNFAFPAACEIGRTCEVQNYVDDDPGPGVRDWRGLERTYQDHSGVDIRLPDLAAQRAGVNVLAAAAGTVLRVRDGVADVSVQEKGLASVEAVECGNGVIVEHADGWQTQYCHMANGSLRVKPGQAVAAGEPLGRIGLSGQTEYPHLHFTVRRAGQVVDPFAPGAAAPAPLWRADVLQTLAYKRGAVLNAGFTSARVEMTALEERALPAPTRSGPLIAYARAIALEPGDVREITLLGPGGAVLATNRADPLQRARAQDLLFAGKMPPPGGWPAGTYTARYRVLRAGQVALARDVTLGF